MNSALRLLWALPLVLAMGAATILVLRRFVVSEPRSSGRKRLIARESVPLSNDTRAHLIELDGVSYLIVESTLSATQTTVVQSPGSREARPRLQPVWFGRWPGITR